MFTQVSKPELFSSRPKWRDPKAPSKDGDQKENTLMSNHNTYYVYLMTNDNNNVLYVGVTNDLLRRVDEHRKRKVKGFTEKYNVMKLVYFEETEDANEALAREKQIINWRREKKNGLVEQMNPNWEDLGEQL